MSRKDSPTPKRNGLKRLDKLVPLALMAYVAGRYAVGRLADSASVTAPVDANGAATKTADARDPQLPLIPVVPAGAWEDEDYGWTPESESEPEIPAAPLPLPVPVSTKLSAPAPAADAPAAAAVAAPVAVAAAPETESVSSDNKFSLTKKLLVLAMLAGIVAFVLGSGTFATFSAQTGNPGSGIATGTLTMSDQVNSITACSSTDAASLDNYNASCNAILALTNLAPNATGTNTGFGAVTTYGSGVGGASGAALVTIKNTGSINASTFSLWASYVNTKLNSAIASGATVSSLTVTPIEGPVTYGDSINVSSGSSSQIFCAGASAAPGATSITVSGTAGSCTQSTTASQTYPVGSRIEDQSTNKSNGNIYGPTASQTTTFNGAVTSGATSIVVSGNSNFPSTGAFNIWADSEEMTVTAGGGTNTWTVTRGVNGTTAASHANGATITDVPDTDCFDQQTASAPAGFSGATYGQYNGGLTFDSPYSYPLCRTALLWIQEQTNYNGNTYNYCWFGAGSTKGNQTTDLNGGGAGLDANEDANGQCRTPTTMTVGTSLTNFTGSSTTLNTGGTLSAGATSITLTANPSGFASGQTILVDQEQMTLGSNTSGTTWNVTRGVNGSVAATHNNGATVQLVTSLKVGTLTGNIRVTDQITLIEAGVTMTCNAGAPPTTTYSSSTAYFYNYNSTANPIPLYNCATTGGSTTFDSGATVYDASSFQDLNGDNHSSTLTNFDTNANQGGKISMPPLQANGRANYNASVELAAAGTAGGTGIAPDTRKFYIGVYFPANVSIQNYLQGLASTFGITWHIDQ